MEPRRLRFCAVPLAKVSEPPMMTYQYLMWLLLLVTHGPFVGWRPPPAIFKCEMGWKEHPGEKTLAERKGSNRDGPGIISSAFVPHRCGGGTRPPRPHHPIGIDSNPNAVLSCFQGPGATFQIQRGPVGLMINNTESDDDIRLKSTERLLKVGEEHQRVVEETVVSENAEPDQPSSASC